jgi:hypothetical protein
MSTGFCLTFVSNVQSLPVVAHAAISRTDMGERRQEHFVTWMHNTGTDLLDLFSGNTPHRRSRHFSVAARPSPFNHSHGNVQLDMHWTFHLRIGQDHKKCRFSFPVSYRGPLNCGDAGFLT